MEQEAMATYQRLAAATDVPELKNLFTMLAMAEEEHHNALIALKMNPDLQQVSFDALQEAACLFKPLLARRDQLDERKEWNDEYQQIVGEEEKGVKLYEELAQQAHDQQTREILLKIADEERRHLSIVENIYSFVESPKNFLAWGEFSNLKEY
jgi:rubrerythrin